MRYSYFSHNAKRGLKLSQWTSIYQGYISITYKARSVIGSPRATLFNEIAARLSNCQRCFVLVFFFTSRDSMQSILEGLFALHMLSHPLENTERKRRWHISTFNFPFRVRGDVSCGVKFYCLTKQNLRLPCVCSVMNHHR